MKTTIALKALIASLIVTSVSAVPKPRVGEYERNHYCMKSYSFGDGPTTIYDFCDEYENNMNNNREVNKYGCTDDQVIISTERNVTKGEEFPVQILSCKPVKDRVPGTIQPMQL